MLQKLTLILLALVIVSFSFQTEESRNKPAKVVINSYTGKSFNLPKSIGFINDFENDFTSDQIAELDSIVRWFESKTTNQIAIVSIESIEPYKEFSDYSLALFNTWGIGRKDINNGLLILFSKKLRQVRITTGRGTEKVLTDAICQKVVYEKMISNFKKDLHFEGIKEGLLELIRLWN